MNGVAGSALTQLLADYESVCVTTFPVEPRQENLSDLTNAVLRTGAMQNFRQSGGPWIRIPRAGVLRKERHTDEMTALDATSFDR